ncbi:MAG TPA: hypothetical protein VE988_03215 [Gemmataceae bacterium]|nr:hypothetical protein [Gemmataceae bacterium]
MRKLCGCFALLTAVILALPESTDGQQKNPGKKKQDTVNKEETTPLDYAYLAQAKEVQGKIVDVSVVGGTLTLNIEWSHMEPNPNPKAAQKAAKGNQKAAQLQQQVLRDYNKIMTDPNPVHRQQALIKFQMHVQQLQATNANLNANLPNLFVVVKSSKDFDLDVTEEVKVARTQLADKYNDEGELIKYTAEELKKMKHPEMPGYKATWEDLRTGQTVKLYISPPKKQPAKKTDADSKKTDPDAKKAGSDAKKSDADPKKSDPAIAAGKVGKDDQTGDAKDKQPEPPMPSGHSIVRMVLILEEAPPPPDPPADKGKKKKKG